MSGPPYPPGPQPGSNAIGSFQIGVSPIGTIPPFNYRQTIISQYANSSRLTAIIDAFFQCVDQTRNFDSFFDMIFNVDTAQGYGLDVWGRIVGVQRVLQVQAGKYLGWEEAGNVSSDPWGQSPWYSGATLTSNFSLSDAAFRTLVFAKALANISDGSIKSINQILRTIFPGRGNAYVQDNLNMSLTYVFAFALTGVELAIVTQSGVLPKPVGVAFSVQHP